MNLRLPVSKLSSTISLTLRDRPKSPEPHSLCSSSSQINLSGRTLSTKCKQPAINRDSIKSEHLEVRAELKRLFIQYCEFKEETAEAHLTHDSITKLRKEAGIPASRQLEKALAKPFRHQGTINFEEFLNL